MVDFIVKFSEAEGAELERKAHERGYDSVEAYLLALVEEDEEELEDEEDDDYISPAESFRRGWAEVMRGEIRPIEELWDALEDDD